MSVEEVPVGVKIGEKFFGLLIIIVGFILFFFAYSSYSNLSGVVSDLPFLAPSIFLFVGASLLLVGILLIFAKQE